MVPIQEMILKELAEVGRSLHAETDVTTEHFGSLNSPVDQVAVNMRYTVRIWVYQRGECLFQVKTSGYSETEVYNNAQFYLRQGLYFYVTCR